jgi:hypothetical protein
MPHAAQTASHDLTIVDISGLNRDLSILRLWPHMAHPDDGHACERYGAFLVAKLYFAANLAISDETQGYLVEAARFGVGDDLFKAIPGGCMAGDVLLARLEMDKAQVIDAGIDKACNLVSESYGHIPKGALVSRGFFTGDRKFHKASRETVFDNWNKYCRAAHLWAAFIILLRDAERNGVRNEPQKWLDGQKIASIAMALKTRASKVVSSRNARPPLPHDAIEIVGAIPVTIEPPIPNIDFWTIINTHKPRKKTSE